MVRYGYISILAVGLLSVAGLLTYELLPSSAPKPSEYISRPSAAPGGLSEADIDKANVENMPAAENSMLSRLLNARWSKAAAQAVLDLNREWFTILREEHPAALEEQLYLLSKLGRYPQLMPMLENRPEIASLLSMADDPQRFAQSLADDECFDTVAGLYAQHAERRDAIELSSALQNNRDLICRLWERGLVGMQSVFWFPREESDRAGWEAYERWMRQLLDAALRNPEQETLQTAMVVLLVQGEQIRRRMIEQADFRNRFESELWPPIARRMDQPDLLYLYLDDAYLWDAVNLPERERLLDTWAWVVDRADGYSPGEILFGAVGGKQYFHLRERLLRAMLEQNVLRLHTLLHFGTDDAFLKLLERGLPEHLEDIAFEHLNEAGNPFAWLEDKLKTDTHQIARELTGKADGTLNTAKKMIQGREISGGEVFWATLDVADAVWIAATLGGGALITGGLKQAGKQAAKKGAKELLGKSGELMLKRSGKQLSQSQLKRAAIPASKDRMISSLFGLRDAAAKNTAKVTAGQGAFELGTVGAKNAARIMAKEGMGLDITPVLRLTFEHLPGGMRSVFLKKGATLQARQFMRSDRKVIMRLSCDTLDGIGQGAALLARFLDATSVVATGLEQAGNACYTKSAIKRINLTPQTAAPKNISAWFFAHATSALH